jgi:predicted ATP-binding protein involved in virulence
MRIDTLHVKNFKCFEDAQWNFTPGFNILIGDNGAGKTSILEALRVAIGSFFVSLPDIPSPPIDSASARNKTENSENPDPELISFYPVSVSIKGDFYFINRFNSKIKQIISLPIMSEIPIIPKEMQVPTSQMMPKMPEKIHWIRSKSSRQNKTIYKDFKTKNILSMFFTLRNYHQVNCLFPLLAYYSTARRQKPKRIQNDDLFARGDFQRGYIGALSEDSDPTNLWKWIKTMEFEAVQSGRVSETLESVRRAALTCLEEEGFTWVGYSGRLREPAVKDKEGNLIPVSFLSDGQVTILEMVLDIARRAVLLNPFLQERAAQETPGVVLIDELELHLHPTWQRRIVDNLRRTFPLVQFIATTHAPLILQSLSPETDQIIQLLGSDGKHNIIVPDPRKTPEELLEDPMETPLTQRSHASQERFRVAQEYYRLLRDTEGASPEKIKAIKDELDILMIPYYENEAYAAYVSFLREERIASGIDKVKTGEQDAH